MRSLQPRTFACVFFNPYLYATHQVYQQDSVLLAQQATVSCETLVRSTKGGRVTSHGGEHAENGAGRNTLSGGRGCFVLLMLWSMGPREGFVKVVGPILYDTANYMYGTPL